MTQITEPFTDGEPSSQPQTSTTSAGGSDVNSDPSFADIKSLVEQWTEIFDNCLKKLSGAERKKLRAFDRENLVASLGQDFRQWKLPESMSSDVRPFFEQTKMLIQKLREALTLPGPYQPEFKSELLDGGGYVVLWNSSADQDAVKKARSLLKTVLDHISNLQAFTSQPPEQYCRPLTESCIAIIQLLSDSTLNFGKNATVPNTLEKKLRVHLDRFRQEMEEAMKTFQISVQFSNSDAENLAAPFSDKMVLTKSEPVWMNTPSLQHDFFLGRKRDLASIEDFFRLPNQSGGPLLAMFYGMGGVGKTTLALHYYETQRSDSSPTPRYSHGFWINAESQSSIDRSFHDMALALRRPASNAQEAYIEVMEWLNSKANEHRWLLVLDNVDVTDIDDQKSREKMDRFQKILPAGPGHVIVTTRYFFPHRKIKGFHIQKLDQDESLVIFDNYRRMYDPNIDTATEEADSRQLLERFDGLPLALKVAARYINDLGGVKAFIDEYATFEDDFLEDTDGMSIYQKLNTVWEIPFTRLSSDAYANARHLFGLMCLMASDDIPVHDFFSREQTLDANFKFLQTELVSHRRKPLGVLRDLGLIDIRNFATDSASIHRVLSAAFRNSAHGLRSPEALQLVVDTAAIILNRLFPKHEGVHGLWDRWAQCSKYMKHVEGLIKVFTEFEQKHIETTTTKLRSSPDMDELMKNCCWYQCESGHTEAALQSLEFATKISLDKESKEYATLCQAYACTYFELNRLQDCEKWNKECLRIRQIHLDEDDPDIANCRSNLANLYTAIGKFEDARKEITQAMKPLSEDRPEDLFYLGMRHMMVGRSYLRQNEFDEADRCYIRSRDLLERCNATFLLQFLALEQGNLALDRGQPQEALKYFQRTPDEIKSVQTRNAIVGVLVYKTCLANFQLQNFTAARIGLDEVIEQARIDRLSGACKLSGQEPRALRLKAQILAEDPKSTDAEKARVPELHERAVRLKKELLLVNKGMLCREPETEQKEFDSLLSGYYR